MPDLLTHVLVAYSVATVLSWRFERLTPQYVTVAMAGAMAPDLSRVDLVLPAATIETALGIPFRWGAFHTLGGSLLVIAIGALFVPNQYRRQVFVLLCFGMLSHHALDLLLIKPSGHSYAVLWPLTQYHPPTPGIYLSTDRWPAVVSFLLAMGIRTVSPYLEHYTG